MFCFISCKKSTNKDTKIVINQLDNLEQEKAAILETLHAETKAAFQRDYEGGKGKWVHTEYVAKTYMNFSDSSMTETLLCIPLFTE